MSNQKLQGKIALITGGTSGIGAAAAKLFQAEGATVAVTGTSEKSVQAAQAQMPGITALASDASDVSAGRSLIDSVVQQHGRIDVLFLNAGIVRMATTEATEEVLFDEVFGTDVRGPYFMVKHAIPVLSDGASIILTSSTTALQGSPGLSAYSAAKAALRSLGMTLAVELAPRRIRVNTISPGPVNTPISTKITLTEQQQQGFMQMIGRIPLGRPAEADEIAAAALYFASDESRFTTGTNLVIDGGLTLV